MTPQEMWDAVLTEEAFSLVLAHADESTSRLLDREGNCVYRLSQTFVDALDDMQPEQALTVLRTVYSVREDEWKRGYQAGKTTGRDDTIDFVHKLIGVDKICHAIESFERTLRDVSP